MCNDSGDVLSEHVREHIACNKAIAIAKRCAKERTARNKAAAVAKRIVRARKPSWNITTATDVYFGIAEINSSAQVGPCGLALSSNKRFKTVSNLAVSSAGETSNKDVTCGVSCVGNPSSVGPSGLAHISEKAVENAFSNISSSSHTSPVIRHGARGRSAESTVVGDDIANIFQEFGDFFCDTTGVTEPSGSELTSPDLHPVLVKDNSLEGVSEPESHNNISTTDLKRSPDHNERNPTTHPNVPSEPVNFGDKRRRLISTPLFTGYYVSDRPPDGQTHNHSIR